MKKIPINLSVIIFFIICLNIFISTASSEEFIVYEDSEIFLRYPSNWNVQKAQNSDAGTIIFTEPNWTKENGGSIVSYSVSTFSENFIFDETNKDNFVNGYLEGLRGNGVDVTFLSSKIISIDIFSALKFEYIIRINPIEFKSRSIFVADGDRIHMLSYSTTLEDFDTYKSTFDEIIASFRIKEPHEILTETYREPTAEEMAGRAGESFVKFTALIIGIYFGSKLLKKN